MLCLAEKQHIYQFYNLWFDLIRAQTHDLLKLQQCELNIYKLVKLKLQQCELNIYRKKEIYNIGVLRVNIEFMWRDLETGERQALEQLYYRFGYLFM
jgi:hypothetical protein